MSAATKCRKINRELKIVQRQMEKKTISSRITLRLSLSFKLTGNAEIFDKSFACVCEYIYKSLKTFLILHNEISKFVDILGLIIRRINLHFNYDIYSNRLKYFNNFFQRNTKFLWNVLGTSNFHCYANLKFYSLQIARKKFVDSPRFSNKSASWRRNSRRNIPFR